MVKPRLLSLFKALGIPAKPEHRPVVSVNCPFCSRPDTGFHCGVFLTSLRFSCWRCKRTGTLRSLLYRFGVPAAVVEKALSGAVIRAGDSEAAGLADRVRRALNGRMPPPIAPSPRVVMPGGEPITAELVDQEPLLRLFLQQRNIAPETCQAYDAVWTGDTGDSAHRVAVPVYDEMGQLAAWQGRDVSGRHKAKYFTEGRCSELLYWTDLRPAPGRVYVVEGVLDAWRMAVNAAAVFGSGISRTQMNQLSRSRLAREVVFAWDGDKAAEAEKAAKRLAPLMRAGSVRLPEGEDPDSLGGDAVRALEVRWA